MYVCSQCQSVYVQASGALGDRLDSCRTDGCGGRPVRIPVPTRLRWITSALDGADSYWVRESA